MWIFCLLAVIGLSQPDWKISGETSPCQLMAFKIAVSFGVRICTRLLWNARPSNAEKHCVFNFMAYICKKFKFGCLFIINNVKMRL